MTYSTILLDPPWNERGGGKSKRGADRHYPVASTPEILKVLMRSGRWQPDTRACSVWMWATNNYLDEALWLMEKLGAKYVTNVVWVKALSATACKICGCFERDEIECHGCGAQVDDDMLIHAVYPQAPGLGQRVRMCHELLLFGRIGTVPVPPPPRRMPSVIYAPRSRHSAKPVEAYGLIEAHDKPGRRIEFFARSARDGWEAWGNEAPEAVAS